jgi:hypothetical protein
MLDVCSFAAGDTRIAIVRPDRQRDRFGRLGARYRRDWFATNSIVKLASALTTPLATIRSRA